MSTEEQAIHDLLKQYEQALNQADTDTVMQLYTPDGIFMPQHSPSSIGEQAVRKAYEAVFQSIQLTVRFEVAEAHQLAPEWAFARTNSAGSVRVLATGATTQEANQELFVLQKVGGAWKIARYCFSTTLPPRS